MPTLSFSREDVALQLELLNTQLPRILTSGKLSKRLLADMLIREAIGLDLDLLLQRISEIEDGQNSPLGFGPPSDFKRPPLQGLSKAHFPENALSLIAGNAGKVMSSKRAKGIIQREFRAADQHNPSHEGIENVARFFSEGVINELSVNKKITGEWLVFSSTSQGNRYLALARHRDDDAETANAASLAAVEFPEVEWGYPDSSLPKDDPLNLFITTYQL